MRALLILPLLFYGVIGVSAPAAASPEDIDHYLCYQITAYDGPADIPVSLRDQFGRLGAVAAKPTALCNPVDKNGEGIRDREAHLVCYTLTRIEGEVRERSVTTKNQFGETRLQVSQPQILCVPSYKEETGR